MNNIDIIYKKNKSFTDFANYYVNYLNKVFKSINNKELINLEKEFLRARSKNATIFIFGNGGSASTSATMANDLGFDIFKKTGKKGFKIICLNDNTSVLTAISNDVGYENVFINQLQIHYKKNDVVLMISASGNSANLIKAANWLKEKKGKILSILGFDGGILRKISDHSVLVKTEKGEYGIVEDVHLIINHILAHWFQNKFRQSK
jgi:D-sedoheptulose 7-phosphate isomerase